MKTALSLTVFLAVFSVNSWSQEVDYDKRNMHIFCASHLTLMEKSLADGRDQRQALAFLAGMHRDEAKKMGANEQHFSDVAMYLNKVRNQNQPKWKQLSFQSRQVCLPDA